jgi:hypothetical protein
MPKPKQRAKSKAKAKASAAQERLKEANNRTRDDLRRKKLDGPCPGHVDADSGCMTCPVRSRCGVGQ